MEQEVMVVSVQFTGKATTYDYQVVPDIDREAVMAAAGGGQGVCRVVVPGKIKEDGTLSLSIATVVSHRMVPKTEPGLKTMYPIVKAIHPLVLDMAKFAVAMLDGAREKQAAAEAEEKAKQ